MKNKVSKEPIWLSDKAWFYSEGQGIEIHTESGEKIKVAAYHLPSARPNPALKKYLFHLLPCPIAQGMSKSKCTCGLLDLLGK